ncbi:MAG: hypothetical protein CBB68_00850 [Rhodospirillaceae bacterium TMED8]|nr:serine/threonine protein kinase [Magnetovibrio sp.]OUT53232.1 MAG: hypothetical protein CBB68_00850 [Rhodospirillaceae bacterium TMED8]|tara:strand:+ start:31 stop:483 length:453 start_codon:yes stop_codon:yes gene_type:complete
MSKNTQLHATCIAHDGYGVLFRGPSGSGKSDLALRLIEAGWELVADDRVNLRLLNGLIIATAPSELMGLIEVRGIGILRVNSVKEVPLKIVCELVTPAEIERLPNNTFTKILDCPLNSVLIAPFQISAVAKVKLALKVSTGIILRCHEVN